jgi:hypothetical protein
MSPRNASMIPAESSPRGRGSAGAEVSTAVMVAQYPTAANLSPHLPQQI